MTKPCDAYEEAMAALARKCIGWAGHRAGGDCPPCEAYQQWLETEGADLQAAYDEHLAHTGDEAAVEALEVLEADYRTRVVVPLVTAWECAGSTFCTTLVDRRGGYCDRCRDIADDGWLEARLG